METEGFKALKYKIHYYLSHDKLKEAIATLFQLLAEHPRNGLEKRTIITAAAYKRLENAWRGQIVDWNTYAGGKNALIAEVYEIIEGIEQLHALPADDSPYEKKHQEIFEKTKRLLRKLGEAPETPMAALLLALGLAASERITSSFTDPRDGRVYRTVRLIGKTWMAENLNYDVGDRCWYYDDDPKYGEKYGRLYTWWAARKACPPGWRLPADEEWRALATWAGGFQDWNGWYKGDPEKAYSVLVESGANGFSALLGGYRESGIYDGFGVFGRYWSGTEQQSKPWYYDFISTYGKLYRYQNSEGYKGGGFSCRCLKA